MEDATDYFDMMDRDMDNGYQMSRTWVAKPDLYQRCQIAGDKLLTTPNPDVNEDMKMFDLLGLVPMKPFAKKDQPESVEAQYSKYKEQGEKPKWSRPGHTIERNLEAKAKAK